jgi:type I restriction enzyme S subunit
MDSPEHLFTHYSLPAFDNGRIPIREKGAEIRSTKTRVPAHSVLVSKLNPRIPRVWRPDVGSDPAVASTEFVCVVPNDLGMRAVVWAIADSSMFSERLASRAAGTTGSHQRVKPAEVLEVEIGYMSDRDRRLFAQRNGPALDLASALRQENVQLAATRDALLPKLMSGELRVKDAEQRVEAVL